MSDILCGYDIEHLLVDVDGLSQSFPREPGDRFGTRLASRNLAAIWVNHLEAGGASRALLSVVVESDSAVQTYKEAIPAANIAVCRLRASTKTLQERVRRRELGAGLEWHLNRAIDLAEIMDRSGIDEIVVDTDDLSVPEIASKCLDRAGWLPS